MAQNHHILTRETGPFSPEVDALLNSMGSVERCVVRGPREYVVVERDKIWIRDSVDGRPVMHPFHTEGEGSHGEIGFAIAHFIDECIMAAVQEAVKGLQSKVSVDYNCSFPFDLGKERKDLPIQYKSAEHERDQGTIVSLITNSDKFRDCVVQGGEEICVIKPDFWYLRFNGGGILRFDTRSDVEGTGGSGVYVKGAVLSQRARAARTARMSAENKYLIQVNFNGDNLPLVGEYERLSR